MSKKSLNLSIPEELVKKARDEDINLSDFLTKKLRNKLQSTYYFWNTDKAHLPNGNDGTKALEIGIAATYGGYDDKIEKPEIGDYIFAYVSGNGLRGFGKVTGDPKKDVEKNQIAPETKKEHQLPVEWIITLNENEAIEPQDIRYILDQQVPAGTMVKIKKNKDRARLLADHIKAKGGKQ